MFKASGMHSNATAPGASAFAPPPPHTRTRVHAAHMHAWPEVLPRAWANNSKDVLIHLILKHTS